MFLCKTGSILLQNFIDVFFFVISLAYLADVFAILTLLNISLQGRKVTILEAEEKMQSYQINLGLSGGGVNAESLQMFLYLTKPFQTQYVRWIQKFVRALLST
jgi:hypothetical protein